MRYLERLRKNNSHTYGEAVTKVTKASELDVLPPFGTFGTPHPKEYEKLNNQN